MMSPSVLVVLIKTRSCHKMISAKLWPILKSYEVKSKMSKEHCITCCERRDRKEGEDWAQSYRDHTDSQNTSISHRIWAQWVCNEFNRECHHTDCWENKRQNASLWLLPPAACIMYSFYAAEEEEEGKQAHYLLNLQTELHSWLQLYFKRKYKLFFKSKSE